MEKKRYTRPEAEVIEYQEVLMLELPVRHSVTVDEEATNGSITFDEGEGDGGSTLPQLWDEE